MVQLAADNIANGYSMTVQPVQASTRTAARGIFEMELCKYAVNAGLNDFNQTVKSSTSLMTESAKTASGNYTVTVSNGSGICGSASLSVEGNGTTDQSTIGKFFNPFSKNEYSGVISAQRAAMDNMISDMDNAASEFVTTFLEKEILATEHCRISRHGFREQPTSMNALYKNRYLLITENNPGKKLSSLISQPMDG